MDHDRFVYAHTFFYDLMHNKSRNFSVIAMESRLFHKAIDLSWLGRALGESFYQVDSYISQEWTPGWRRFKSDKTLVSDKSIRS